MNSTTFVTIAAAALALGACKDKASDLQDNVEKVGAQIAEDPDIKEAKQAIEGVIDDKGEGLKTVTREARSAKEAQPDQQNVDESKAD